jgi:hypothetical protein
MPAGEIVSGSNFPKYSGESVERSLASSTNRLKSVNQDSSTEYRIVDVIAFRPPMLHPVGTSRSRSASMG